MSDQPRTAGGILEERICRRLADLATEMAMDTSSTWEELRSCYAALTEDSFQVIYDLKNYDGAMFPLIENAVNENTNQMVKDTHGEYTFDLDVSDDDGGRAIYNMITFDPETCTDSKERYAALMVAQRFESMLENDHPGRLKPAGTMFCHAYGTVCTPGFMAFAYVVNSELKDHALPEGIMGRVDFSETPKVTTPAPQAA